MKHLILFGAFMFIFFGAKSQEVNETNTDSIYLKALDAYKAGNFEHSLKLTQRGLELAPEYHDIRILQIRNYWALNNYAPADAQLAYLWENAPNYVDVKPITKQRINRFEDPTEAISFIDRAAIVFPEDVDIQISKAQNLLKNNQKKEARELAFEVMEKEGISGAQRYALQLIINQTISNEVGVIYEYIGFSDDYSRRDSWHTISPQFQNNFNRTAVLARVNFSTWGNRDDILYELEAYPVFSDKFYAFANVGVSSGEIFPNLRSSLSLFYNFAGFLEAEAGARLMHFDESDYLTGIIGLTAYQGKFYLNARAFVGPERLGRYVQNYQGNVRYYFLNADNYLFLRFGSGISPDERIIFSQVQQNPRLDAYYANLGINKTFGARHVFQLGAGILSEDITPERSGIQFLGNASYRYRF